jgi:Arrestin (or S-antigen), C-terminal domain
VRNNTAKLSKQSTNVVSYCSNTPRNNTKWKTEKMVEVRGKGVGAPTATAISDFVLPSMLVNSNSLYCNVVQVSYNLSVKVQVSGWHKNFKMVFPIVIGSVPIDLSQTYNNAPMQMPYTGFANGPIPSAPMPYNNGK